MRPVLEPEWPLRYDKLGMMVLSEQFEQRKIESTYGSFRSFVPLPTASGPQWTESELETELLEQLAFSPLVYDLITQPIIYYTLDGESRRYTPDIAVQLNGTSDDLPQRYLIEVKRQQELLQDPDKHRVRFEVGRACAEQMGAVFRIMDETQIRSPYLQNARLLSRYRRLELTEEEYLGMDVIYAAMPLSIGQAIKVLGREGFAEPDARHILEFAIAGNMIDADLTVALTDQTIITNRGDRRFFVRKDPVLRRLHDAPDR
ncbi:TnsA endonuclease N-terminal domain-containing protein [Sphingopyxis sp.]|uniref:TnsA endonuclease N-terminal domain-containing protein n=1 Tax=Sphingopyxis sp. TaxID=1908224 RepID=UPI0010F7E4E7|nr:TnsA endonuclease N-terminal domain-containing protein [Sphingopyxis sp.]MBR2173720.1 TnsA endonuclease N-terminal domain-containing protein [Sphingopyxis sp.]